MSGCRCQKCGQLYLTDLVIPTLVWVQISPKGNEGGLLCPNCIIARLEQRGLSNVPSYFASGPLCLGDAAEPVWRWTERLLELERHVYAQ